MLQVDFPFCHFSAIQVSDHTIIQITLSWFSDLFWSNFFLSLCDYMLLLRTMSKSSSLRCLWFRGVALSSLSLPLLSLFSLMFAVAVCAISRKIFVPLILLWLLIVFKFFPQPFLPIISVLLLFSAVFKGTVMQIQKTMINDRLRVSKVFWKFHIPTIYNFAIIYPWNLLFS